MTTKCLCCDREDAGHRYACSSCVDRMRRWLRDVETYAAMLPHMLEPMREDAARRAPGFGSQPPVRLEALIALDRRSRDLAYARQDCDGGIWDGETDDESPTGSILDRLWSIARWVREEQELPEPSATPTIIREVGYLLGAVDWCSQKQWVDELYDQIKELHAEDRRLVKDSPPGPLGDGCLTVTCGGKVYWQADVPDPKNEGQTLDAARCQKCQRLYYGTDLVRLRVGRSREAS